MPFFLQINANGEVIAGLLATTGWTSPSSVLHQLVTVRLRLLHNAQCSFFLGLKTGALWVPKCVHEHPPACHSCKERLVYFNTHYPTICVPPCCCLLLLVLICLQYVVQWLELWAWSWLVVRSPGDRNQRTAFIRTGTRKSKLCWVNWHGRG